VLRSLIHFWRMNLAVIAGVAVTTAVLTGALMVGDSLRGSLRDLTLDRLGRTDQALLNNRFFPATLASRLALQPDFAAHHVDQFFTDCQTQSCAAVFAGGGGVGLGKRLKKFAGLLLGQPDTGVSDREL